VLATKHKDKHANIPAKELRDFVPEADKAPKNILCPRDPSLTRNWSPGSGGASPPPTMAIRGGTAFLSFDTFLLLHNSFYTLSCLSIPLGGYWPTLEAIIQ